MRQKPEIPLLMRINLIIVRLQRTEGGLSMEKILLKTETTDDITWPRQCPACAAELGADHEVKCEVKVKKGMKASFSPKTPKTISVTICDNCSRKISRANPLAYFGWGLMGLIFLAIYFHKGPISQQQGTAIGAFIWLGAILVWIGKRRQRNLVGMKILLLSKDRWAFWFKNKTFGSVFREQNISLEAKT